MVTSVEIPQDIIDNVIEAVGDDKHLLKQCTLVSSSFLLPSRKQLFSRITLRSDKTSQGIHQFLLQYPVIQSFVRSITLSGVESKWVNGSSLLAILRLPFRRLECFSIQARNVWDCWNWNSFSSELRDALSNIMLSSTLKTLSLAGISEVPISFFIHIVHLTTLELYALSPEDFGDVGDITTLEFYSPSLEDFGDQNSSSLTRTNLKGVAPTVIDRCVWHFPEGYNVPYYGPTESIFLPFMCRLRFFQIYIETFEEFHFLSFLFASLRISLTSPATLEHLELNIRFYNYNSDSDFHSDMFYENLCDADVWNHLDSITVHSTSSRLRRVDINITYSLAYHDNWEEEPDEDEVVKAVLDGLPLLRSKGILFVKAEYDQCQ